MVQEVNLRPLYKKIDSMLQEQIIYPAKYEDAKRSGIMKRLLKKKPSIPKDVSLVRFGNGLNTKSPEFEVLFQNLEQAGLSKDEASQVLYDRISHNASKHLKLSQEEIDSTLKTTNTLRLDNNQYNRLIPPYLLESADLEEIAKSEDSKSVFATIGRGSKILAAKNAKKPYALGASVKAYDSYIKMAEAGYVEEPNLDQIKADCVKVKESYYDRLLSENKKRKKFPKKHLTEFEKRGYDLVVQFHNAQNDVTVAAKAVKEAQKAFDKELEKSYTKEVKKTGGELWSLLRRHHEGKKYEHPEQEKLVLNAYQRIKDKHLQVSFMKDVNDPGYQEIEQIVKYVAGEHLTQKRMEMGGSVTAAKEELLAAQARASTFSREEKPFVEAFISYITDNKKFNKRMGRALRSGGLIDKTLPVATRNVLFKSYSLIHKHSYKTIGIKKLQSIKSKLGKLVGRMNKKETILKDERIDLAELGIVERYNGNGEFFRLIESISPESDELKSMVAEHKELRPLESSFYKHIKDDAAKTFKTGDIILDSAILRRKIDGKKADGFDRIMDRFTKYDHAALAWAGDNVIVKSHVTQNDIEQSVESAEELIISEHYRIHPEVLIRDKKMKENLKLVLAQEGPEPLDLNGPKLSDEQLSEKLGKLFQLHSSFIHRDIQAGKKVYFENPEGRQLRAEIADLIPIRGHKKGHSNKSWVEKVIGRSKEKDMDLRQALLEDTDGKMICSEYAARVTLLSLVKLDDVLKEKMDAKGAEVKGKGVMSLPLMREKLSKVHPERLLKLLPKKAVEKVESALAKSAIKGA